ncbi:MAG TPA: DNA alkylation response protein, partial [Planctomycetaceae bacterium]|nr:DNA alkylation response protein [Planctomycetaceae bacterium]
YEPSNAAPLTKRQVLLGMGMTEKQGGTDVRANTTRAQKVDSQWWQITGHKWFMSAPQSESILVLAQMPEG